MTCSQFNRITGGDLTRLGGTGHRHQRHLLFDGSWDKLGHETRVRGDIGVLGDLFVLKLYWNCSGLHVKKVSRNIASQTISDDYYQAP